MKLYSIMTDAKTKREYVRAKALDGLRAAFPMVIRDNKLEMSDLKVQEKDFGPNDQKHAKLSGTTLHEPVKATLTLKDATGATIDEVKNFTLLHLPYLTERHTFILDGNEYNVSNQIRMKPGVYTRRRANDELEAAFNLAKGSNFRLSIDPLKGHPYMEYSTTMIPLYPVLRKLGVSHDQIAKSWGNEVANANATAFDKKADVSLDKLYKKLVHPSKQVATTTEAKVQAINETYAVTTMDPEVNQATLGHPHDKVTTGAMLDASKKLLNVYKSGEDVDDRDSLAFKTFHSVDDFIKERIVLDSRAVASKVKLRATNKNTIREIMSSAPFSSGVRSFITGSQLSAIPTEINPMEMIDHSMKVTSLGEGGIASERAIPMEARQLHSTHIGLLDPIRTPECFEKNTEIYTKTGWKNIVEITMDDLCACNINGTLEFHKPNHLFKQRYTGLMYGINTGPKAGVEYLVTPNHRVWCRPNDPGASYRMVLAEDVHMKRRVFTGRHDPYVGNKNITTFNFAEFTRPSKVVDAALSFNIADWCEFVGWYLAEGNISLNNSGNPRDVYISQTEAVNGDNCKRLVNLFTRMQLKFVQHNKQKGYTIHNRQLARYFQPFGYCNDKYIPEDLFEVPAYAREKLYEGLMLGDGRIDSNRASGKSYKQEVFTTSSPMLARDFERLAISLGKPVKTATYKDKRNEAYLLIYEVRVIQAYEKAAYPNKNHYYTVNHDDDVYCAEVPGGMLYTRLNKSTPIWSGNSFKAGVDIRASILAFRDEPGNLYTSVRNVKTGKLEYLSAKEMSKTVLAFPGQKMTGIIDVMKDGKVQHVPAEQVQHAIQHSFQLYSPTTNLIPMMESIQGNRATMGSKMQTQALPLVDREEPLVQVGAHNLDGTNSLTSFESMFGKLIVPTAPVAGKIEKIDSQFIYLRPHAKKEGALKSADFVFKKVSFKGIPIHIDRFKGFEKTVRLPEGGKKTIKYQYDYGFFPGVMDNDGEELDVYVGPNHKQDNVHIIEKYFVKEDGTRGEFDEHKCFVGMSKEDAISAFNYHIGPKSQGNIKTVPISTFKNALTKDGLKQAADEDVAGYHQEDGLIKIPYDTNFPFASKTYLHHTLHAKVGDDVKEDEALGDSNFTHKGVLALGKNMKVGYMAYYGLNSNDAVVISEGAAVKLTSEHMYTEILDLDPDVTLGREIHRIHFGTKYTAAQYRKIAEKGVVKKGQIVMPHDPLIVGVRKTKPSPNDIILGNLKKSLASPYREEMRDWHHDFQGEVIDVFESEKRVVVTVKTKEPMRVGDKLCYDEETEVLTSAGWKNIAEVSLTDKVATLQNDKDLVYMEPTALHKYPTCDKMYFVKNDQVDLLVTTNHNMYVRRKDSDTFTIEKAENLLGKHVYYKKNAEWKGQDPEYIELPAIDVVAGQHGHGKRTVPTLKIPLNTYLMLLGAFISEGNIVDQPKSGSYGIDITQIKPNNRKLLMDSLTAAGVKFNEHGRKEKVRIYSKQLLIHFAQLGRKAPDKHLPNFVFDLSKESLQLLFKWMMWGDGTTSSRTGLPLVYTTTSKELADQFQRLLLHIGKAGNISTRHDPIQIIKGKSYNCARVYKVGIVNVRLEPVVNSTTSSKKYNSTPDDGIIENYDRPVFCITVPGHVIVVRRGGKIVVSTNSGRFGNKGVISHIVPNNQMIQDESGDPVDILYTSQGVVSRINPAQIIETAIGKVADKLGKPIIVENFTSRDNIQWAKDLLKKHNIKDKETVFDPISGKHIPGVLVGKQFTFRLFKTTDSNYAARGTGGYDVNRQPTKGGTEGAKAIGTMEFNALIAHNARNVLRESAALKSQQNDEYWRAVQLGLPLPPLKSAFVYDKFIAMLQGAGIRADKRGNVVTLKPLTDNDIKILSSGAIENEKLVRAKDLKPERGGFFDPSLTGGASGTRWSHVELAEPLVNPIFVEPARRLLGMTTKAFEELHYEKGGAEIKKRLSEIDLDDREKFIKTEMKKATGSKLDDYVKQLKYIRALKAAGLKPDVYVLSKVPVVPPIMRPILPGKGGQELVVGDSNYLYQNMFLHNKTLQSQVENPILPPQEHAQLRQNLFTAVGAVIGTHNTDNPKLEKRNVKGFLEHLTGKTTPKSSFFQKKILKRNQDLSGRGTAAPDATLGMDQIGLPEEMLWELFSKFIIARLVRRGFGALQAKEMLDKRHPAARDSLLAEINERPVMVNRAPTLHRYNVISAFAVPIAGKTIRVNPFIEKGMNLDYDGDTLQVHTPAMPSAVADARKMTLSNLLFGDKTRDDLMVAPTMEAVLGIHIATQKSKTGKTVKFKTREEAMAAYKKGKVDLNDNVEIG